MVRKTSESVWDYPRPPRAEAFGGLVEVIHQHKHLAKSITTYRVLETSHPPGFYIPQDHCNMNFLRKNDQTSMCEFKGLAVYFDLIMDGKKVKNVAWCYENPYSRFAVIKNHLAFYPGRVDTCFVDGEKVTAQEGDFYGGWITSNIEGPFKGGPGTWGW